MNPTRSVLHIFILRNRFFIYIFNIYIYIYTKLIHIYKSLKQDKKRDKKTRLVGNLVLWLHIFILWNRFCIFSHTKLIHIYMCIYTIYYIGIRTRTITITRTKKGAIPVQVCMYALCSHKIKSMHTLLHIYIQLKIEYKVAQKHELRSLLGGFRENLLVYILLVKLSVLKIKTYVFTQLRRLKTRFYISLFLYTGF